MECPVCRNKKISPFATHCSVCDTDIIAFPLLEDLEEQSIAVLKDKISLEGELTALEQLRRRDKTRYRKSLSRMYWFLFLLPLFFFVCGKRNLMKEDTTRVEALQSDNQSLENKNQSLLKRIEELESRELVIQEEVIHVIQKGDNLSVLAKKYLQDGSKWRTLNTLNPDIRDYKKMIPGDTILIKLK
ncbi:MAG: hypothetical protein ACI94Y_000819 [Maribacter sp.]|jgi:hypothetical protein